MVKNIFSRPQCPLQITEQNLDIAVARFYTRVEVGPLYRGGRVPEASLALWRPRPWIALSAFPSDPCSTATSPGKRKGPGCAHETPFVVQESLSMPRTRTLRANALNPGLAGCKRKPRRPRPKVIREAENSGLLGVDRNLDIWWASGVVLCRRNGGDLESSRNRTHTCCIRQRRGSFPSSLPCVKMSGKVDASRQCSRGVIRCVGHP